MSMETNYSSQIHKESGFALLMSLVVMGVLISIGLSVLELSIKQIELSTNVRDSEVAFHAANAGMECGRYWRRESAELMEAGADINPTCFTVDAGVISDTPLAPSAGSGNIYQYDYNFTWGSAPDERCSQIRTLVFNADLAGPDLELDDMQTHAPGYPIGMTTFTCEAGARCTVMSVQGYNKPCGSINEFGTLQREVLLEF